MYVNVYMCACVYLRLSPPLYIPGIVRHSTPMPVNIQSSKAAIHRLSKGRPSPPAFGDAGTASLAGRPSQSDWMKPAANVYAVDLSLCPFQHSNPTWMTQWSHHTHSQYKPTYLLDKDKGKRKDGYNTSLALNSNNVTACYLSTVHISLRV